MSEDKAGAQSSGSAEFGLGKKTGVPASSKEDWKIVTLCSEIRDKDLTRAQRSSPSR